MIKPQALVHLAAPLALFAAQVLAQSSSQPLTLDECVRRAEAAQSNVTIARQQAEIARYARTQAVASFLPQATVGGLFGYNSPLPGTRDTFSYLSANGIREYSALGNVALEVDTSGRLRAQLSRAKADQDAAAATIVLSQRDLRRAVAASFYRLTLARKLIQVADDNLKEAQNFEGRNRLLVENQEVAQADLVKASSQVAFFEQAVNAAELEAKLANHELASFWTAGRGGRTPRGRCAG